MDKPIRISFPGFGGQSLTGFYQEEGGSPITVTTTCTADDITTAGAQLTESDPVCVLDDGTDFIFWTETNTRFGAHRASSTSSGAGSSGSGATGVSPGASFGSISYGGVLASPLLIHEVNYDVCEQNIATVLLSTDSEVPPTVKLHTTKLGTIRAVLAETQPYAELNEVTKLDKLLYEASIDANESFFMVSVTEEGKPIPRTVQTAVYVDECTGTSVLADIPDDVFETVDYTAPQVFDVRANINGVSYLSSTDGLYTDDDVTVSGIISTESPIKRAELRLVPLVGDDDYIALTLNSTALPVENLYTVSASIPAALIQDPAIQYWIHVISEDLDEGTSSKYILGSAPVSAIQASIELDYDAHKAQGKTLKTSSYIDIDSTDPVYGTVHLHIDDDTVSSQSMLFSPGQSKVDLSWSIPKTGDETTYNVSAVLDLYGDTSSTSSGKLYTFAKSSIVSLSQIQSISSVTDESGNVIATPAMIYASDTEKNLQFRVIAPDGQCIIGANNGCIVQDSTYDRRGGLYSVEVDGQIYRVKYSGADNVLERFSITSIDPIVGDWIVQLETHDDYIPQAHAMADTAMKIKYRTVSNDVTLR